MTEHMRTELVADALQMAVARRRPEPGLIHHSDQGSQYVALGFGQQARDAGIAVSMGSKGDAYDNAVAESFFATLKKELVHRQSWPSRRDLSSAVFNYIEAFYNRHRRHSTLGYLSPEEYEREDNHNHEQRLATKAHDRPRNGYHSTHSLTVRLESPIASLGRCDLRVGRTSMLVPRAHRVSTEHQNHDLGLFPLRGVDRPGSDPRGDQSLGTSWRSDTQEGGGWAKQ